MNPGLVASMEAAANGPAMVFEVAIVNMGHAVLLGAALMLMTVWSTYQTLAPAASFATDSNPQSETLADLILASANVLFLCFGMTAVMLLVNNNLARAFAIGAAIALVRFRIKVNSKALSMGLFYGVLTGMACGVGQVYIGYTIVVFFGILQLVVLSLVKLTGRKPKQIAPITPIETLAAATVVSATAASSLPASPATAQSPLANEIAP